MVHIEETESRKIIPWHGQYILPKQMWIGSWFIFLLLLTVDQIYHLASPASPPNYMYNPIKTLKTNTIGTLNMLGEYMKAAKLKEV